MLVEQAVVFLIPSVAAAQISALVKSPPIAGSGSLLFENMGNVQWFHSTFDLCSEDKLAHCCWKQGFAWRWPSEWGKEGTTYLRIKWWSDSSLFYPRTDPLHLQTMVLSKDYFWLKLRCELHCNLDVNLFPLYCFYKVFERPQSLWSLSDTLPTEHALLLVPLQLLRGPLYPFLSPCDTKGCGIPKNRGHPLILLI